MRKKYVRQFDFLLNMLMTIIYTNFNNACQLREQRGDLEEEVGVCAILPK